MYIALKSILDLLQNGKSVSDYDLQIEGEEDFSIRKDCKYISLHQVKAGAIRLEQNDKFSFVIGILQNEAEYGYFHIANGKRIPVDFVSSTLTYISMLKNELKKKVIEKKDIADTDNEDNYIVLDKVSGNHKKADVYSLIKYVSKNSKDIAKIQSVIIEMSAITINEQEVAEIAEHIEKLKMQNCSENIALIKNMPLVREVNTALNGIELVTSVPKSNVEFYERCKAYVSFFLKLKKSREG